MIEEIYSPKQWWNEIQTGKLCGKHSPAGGVCNLKCPDCGAFGWYGPRVQPAIDGRITENEIIADGKSYPITRKYRCCKWCGLLQEAWGNVLDDNPQKAKPYRACLRRHKKCSIDIESLLPLKLGRSIQQPEKFLLVFDNSLPLLR